MRAGFADLFGAARVAFVGRFLTGFFFAVFFVALFGDFLAGFLPAFFFVLFFFLAGTALSSARWRQHTTAGGPRNLAGGAQRTLPQRWQAVGWEDSKHTGRTATMRYDAVPDELRKEWRGLRLLCACMLLGVGIYVFIMRVVAHSHSGGPFTVFGFPGSADA